MDEAVTIAEKRIGIARLAIRSLPQLLVFNGVISLSVALLLGILDYAANILLSSTGTALTTANAAQVLLSWQGALLAIITNLIVTCYIAIDVLAHIYFCESLLTGEPGRLLARALRSMKRAFKSLPRFLNPSGISIFIYIALLSPLAGVGFSIGLTRDLYVPHFIMSVIESTPLYRVAYILFILILAVVGLLHIFALHGVLLDGLSPRQALRESRLFVRKNFTGLVKAGLKMVLALSGFVVIAIIAGLVAGFVVEFLGLGYTPGEEGALLYVLKDLNPTEESISVSLYRSLCFFVSFVSLGVVTIGGLLAASCSVMCVTHLFHWFSAGQSERLGEPAEPGQPSQSAAPDRPAEPSQSGQHSQPAELSQSGQPGRPAAPDRPEEPQYPLPPRRTHPLMNLLRVVLVLVAVGFVSMACGFTADIWMHREVPVQVVAHRLGGDGAPENSMEGLEFAIAEGCYGAETDIQRTKDGHYVINHDNDFSRLCGNAAKPEELTLEEVEQLRIRDPLHPDIETKVLTFEELLDAAKGRIKLFVEFKGASADHQMVDDAVRIVREHGAEDDVVFISLKYDCIEYGKKTYPEFDYGLLIFAGFGDMELLNCDIVLAEEEMTSEEFIADAHEANKEVGVWTANTEEDLRKVLCSYADYVITDKVVFARDVQESLDARSDNELIQDLVWL